MNKKHTDLGGGVIEIDEVEYLIDENAARLIEKGEQDIALVRLVDRAVIVFPRQEILKVIEGGGIVDRLA